MYRSLAVAAVFTTSVTLIGSGFAQQVVETGRHKRLSSGVLLTPGRFVRDAAPAAAANIAAVAPDVAQTSPAARTLSADRSVKVNLCIVDAGEAGKIELRSKGGDVIAATEPEAKLQYEVIISGPHGEVPVYFNVPRDSQVYQAYLANAENDPSQVLNTMKQSVAEPLVRIVARRETRYTDQFLGTTDQWQGYSWHGSYGGKGGLDSHQNVYVQYYGGRLIQNTGRYFTGHSGHYAGHIYGQVGYYGNYGGYENNYNGNPHRRLYFNEPWRPFFEVFLPESNESAMYVPVPETDEEVHRLMKVVTYNDEPEKHLAVLAHLSGPK